MKNIIILSSLFCSASLFAAGHTKATVDHVGIKWGNACALLSNGEQIKMDLETNTGRAEYSTVLAAFASGKRLSVYQTDGDPLDGCNTGPTVKPHSMLYIIN